jgi:dTDP-glucose 4,6-dehydratase
MHPLPQEDLDHVLVRIGQLWESVRGQSVFLTGGTGFVGTWLLHTLLYANDKLDLDIHVAVLTRSPEQFRSKWPQVATHRAVGILAGHVAGFDFPAEQFGFLIHGATDRAFAPDMQRPLGTFDSDIAGTRRILEFARQRGVRRLLFTSSGAVYGRQPSQLTHIPEDYAGAPFTVDTTTAYGQAKRASEFMLSMYGRVYGFDVLIARLFAFVGPVLPLDANYAVGNFIGDVLRRQSVHIAGDGTPYRSYLYAADLAVWLWTILLRGETAHPYNVGSSDAITIAQLAGEVVRVIAPHTQIEIAHSPIPGAAPQRYVPSTARAESELGLRAWIPLEEGIRRTHGWYTRAAAQ